LRACFFVRIPGGSRRIDLFDDGFSMIAETGFAAPGSASRPSG
jgi:hypothetical protein